MRNQLKLITVLKEKAKKFIDRIEEDKIIDELVLKQTRITKRWMSAIVESNKSRNKA